MSQISVVPGKDRPFHETLWKLADSWECDYVALEKDGKITMSLHNPGCRKCDLKRHLIRCDELLKRTAEAEYLPFIQKHEIQAEAMDIYQFEAIKEHAQHIRESFLGCKA